MQAHHNTGAKSTRGAGFAVAVVCYCFLAFLLSSTPAHVLWWLLAVITIPIVIGAMAANGTARIDTPGQRFSSGFWTCSVPMFTYVAFALMAAHHRVGPSGNAGGELFAGLVAAVVYTLIAGLVAGITSIVFYMGADRRGGNA